MIDTVSLLLFGLLNVYTAYRAMILDRTTPWFLEGKDKKGTGSAGKKSLK